MGLTTTVEQGMVIMYDGEPCLIVMREFYKPGKGNALNRTKLKNLKNGRVVSQTFKSGEKVEELDVFNQTMNYLYNDGVEAFFMNPNTFEQMGVRIDVIPEGTDFLHPDGHYVFLIHDGAPLTVKIPEKMALIITETEDGAVAGNTSSNAFKPAKLETGAEVMVPLFIKTGDKILVNTTERAYSSKA